MTPPPPPPLTDPALTELRDTYRKGQLVLFVGAGMSSSVGIPSWKRLCELAIDHARARNSPPAHIDEMRELVSRGQLVDAFSIAYQLFGGPEFCDFVEHHLNDDGRPLSPALLAVSKLQQLRAILTTNLDYLLERAFLGAWPALSRASSDVARRERFILKLHGTLHDRSSWVFTRDQYDRATAADPLLRNAYSSFFHAHHLLFIGFSLVDEDFEALLTQVRALSGDQPPRNHALVAQGTLQGFRRQRIANAGIRLIEYPNPDGTHSLIPDILSWLAS